MIKSEDRNLGDRAYEADHIDKVLKEVRANFPTFFKSFGSGQEEETPLFDNPNFKVITSNKKKPTVKSELTKQFQADIDDFESNQPSYEDFFDMERLEEEEDDPNKFKKSLSKEIPIINRCLNSNAREMKRYKSEFFKKSGRELLDVTYNIVLFGNEFIEIFNEKKHEKAKSVEELRLSELLGDGYISYNVIGGGIKSHFLYSLFPNAFPNRSQNALWSMWYLTNKKDFGFQDGSEFLMIDLDKGTTQQNYHYPYDLFSFYALQVYLLLKEECNKHDILLQDKYRYIYLDTFFNHIAQIEQAEITDLKKSGEYEE
jgi:hypothetical protein